MKNACGDFLPIYCQLRSTTLFLISIYLSFPTQVDDYWHKRFPDEIHEFVRSSTVERALRGFPDNSGIKLEISTEH